METDWATLGVQALVGVTAAGATVWAASSALRSTITADRIERAEDRDEQRRNGRLAAAAELAINRRVLDDDPGADPAAPLFVRMRTEALAGVFSQLNELPAEIRDAVIETGALEDRYNTIVSVWETQASAGPAVPSATNIALGHVKQQKPLLIAAIDRLRPLLIADKLHTAAP